jgi:hypothetical protein
MRAGKSFAAQVVIAACITSSVIVQSLFIWAEFIFKRATAPAALRAAGCSQQELSVWLRAFQAPITRDMVANWETGRATVPAVYIPVLAYALQVEVAGARRGKIEKGGI